MAYLLRNGYSNLQRVTRSICSTAIRRESNKEVVKKVPTNVKESIGIEDVRMGGRTHKVNNLEKRFLVWSGKFKTVEDVPAFVSQEAMEKARNKARIKISNYMMLATAIACLGMVISGKNAAGRGESVQKMNLEWHRSINEKAQEEAAAAAAAVKQKSS